MNGDTLRKPSTVTAQAFVEYALRIGAIELTPKGRPLKSGRISPYFFNSGLFNTGDTMRSLAKAYATTITRNGFRPDVIFGPAYKGIPIATVVAIMLGSHIGLAFNRKEKKEHGEGGSTVGASLEGKRVLIVDDVMTTGTSSGDAMEVILANGGIPIGCVVAFDRQERVEDSNLSAVQGFEKNFNVPVRAIATLADLV